VSVKTWRRVIDFPGGRKGLFLHPARCKLFRQSRGGYGSFNQHLPEHSPRRLRECPFCGRELRQAAGHHDQSAPASFAAVINSNTFSRCLSVDTRSPHGVLFFSFLCGATSNGLFAFDRGRRWDIRGFPGIDPAASGPSPDGFRRNGHSN
jgi:hypothetical protein